MDLVKDHIFERLNGELTYISKYELPFKILSDSSLEVVNLYDVYKEKKLYGKSYMGVVRTTYIINEEGKFIDGLNSLAAGDFKTRLSYKGTFSNHPTVVEVTESFNKLAKELENTEMLRSDFINNFSHEFKTPIVSIAGFAKLLKRGNLTEEQKKRLGL